MRNSALVSPKGDCSPPDRNRLVLSCEHGGARIPAPYADCFAKGAAELASHRGYDIGALELAKATAHTLHAPLLFSTVSRLLVELNRSVHHPALFSEFTSPLDENAKDKILRRYYWPHRHAVEALVAETLESGGRVIHVGVHTFTPVLQGVERTADVGLLYDPSRPREKAFCVRWQERLRAEAPDLRVRRNDPYRGAADGFTTYLRNQFPANRYLGIELEVNNRFVTGAAQTWGTIQGAVIQSLKAAL
jgi:predicted N-formylglutamate amidohydrolase